MKRMFWIVVGGMAAGLALLCFGVWHFMLTPLDSAFNTKEEERLVLEAKLTTTKQRAAQFERFQAEAENVRRALDFYSGRLNPVLTYQDLAGLANGLANGFNFADTKVEIGSRVKSAIKGLGTLDQIELKYSFKGDMNQLGGLVNAFLSSRRLFSPEKMQLRRIEDTVGKFNETIDAIVTVNVLLGAAGGK